LRWLYPAILLGWSAAGFMTGWVNNYTELFPCRVMLGFFEAGQWPCALAASQRLLPRDQRPLGNSILQSGASLGAIATPPIILLLNSGEPGGWRLPFQVAGAAGLVWILVWLMAIRPRDLDITRQTPPGRAEIASAVAVATRGIPVRRFLALVVVVISINLCWQYFRAWMPMMLEKQYGYSKSRTQSFSSLYYLVAGIGCLLAGLVVKWLAGRGWPVHRARMATFAICVLLTAGQHRHGTAPGLLGVAGHPAGGRLWLAGPVSHVLCLHPGTLGAADGQGHGRAQLRDLDIDGVRAGADRPLD